MSMKALGPMAGSCFSQEHRRNQFEPARFFRPRDCAFGAKKRTSDHDHSDGKVAAGFTDGHGEIMTQEEFDKTMK